MSQKVLASFEDPEHLHCVDIFVRADGTHGFEGYRADQDAGVGWRSLGRFSHLVFRSGADALREAQARFAWIDPDETWRW